MKNPTDKVLALCASLCLVGASTPAFAMQATRPCTLVEKGAVRAEIALPRKPSRAESQAAATLVEYVRKSTGAEMQVVAEGQASQTPLRVYLGNTSFLARIGGLPPDLDKEGFVIRFPADDAVIVAGATDWGTEFAVFHFLERFIGVRWLFPGELGEHVPKRRRIDIPAKEIVQSPAFMSRQLSAGYDMNNSRGSHYLWAWRNGMHKVRLSRQRFHHYLNALFPAKQYVETHPHFFPIYGGKRFLPPTDGSYTHNWQPCFSANGIAEEAAQTICDYFDKRPDVESFSVGINDNDSHCECDKCLELDGRRKGWAGKADRSPSYYTWVNRVARLVKAEHPTKRIGLLAYYCTATPPPFGLESNVVPYFTEETTKWLDPQLRDRAQSILEDWFAKTHEMGFYNYQYCGFHYPIPRVYTRHMADCLRYLHEHGVRHYYAEVYQHEEWICGPKLYVLLKLLWEPPQDVERLVDEWCRGAVGDNAAPHLKAFYDFWEQYWTQQASKTPWMSDSTYLDWTDCSYLNGLSMNDLNACERLLEQAVAEAREGKQKRRALRLRDAFARRRRRIVEPYLIARECRDAAAPDERGQVVDQSSFDRDLDGWNTWRRPEHDIRFVWDDGEGHAKPGCLRIDLSRSRGGPAVAEKDITPVPDSVYRVSLSYRLVDLSDDAAVMFEVRWRRKNRALASNVPNQRLRLHDDGAGTWRKAVLYTAVPDPLWEDVPHLAPWIAASGSTRGHVLIDDYELVRIGRYSEWANAVH